jgi:hypothetical protein
MQLGCNDDSSGAIPLASDVHTGALAAGTYYVFIDGAGTSSGTAAVTIETTP